MEFLTAIYLDLDCRKYLHRSFRLRKDGNWHLLQEWSNVEHTMIAYRYHRGNYEFMKVTPGMIFHCNETDISRLRRKEIFELFQKKV